MKKVLILLSILTLATSCQPSPKRAELRPVVKNEDYNAQIKSEKKRQAELDLPYRGFNSDKNLQIIAFGSAATNSWEAIEKNKPELMVLTSTPLSNINALTEYRSIREKIPFMCTSNIETKAEFLKDCPYVKNLIPDNQDGIYHSKIFGTKKNQIQIIMIDQFKTDKSWTWLESEFKKPASLKILTCPTQDREKLMGLIEKYKVTNLILLANDRPVVMFDKTDIKDFKTLNDTVTVTRTVSSEQTPLNFGIIKINWPEHQLKIEIRNAKDEKLQDIDLKF